ncbi:MAG: OmpA family protein [Muribaculaceae bacterium]|nr:OmpA family protein [Muribaculaceae bacterium]
MKKVLLALALMMGFVAAQAQVTVAGSKWTDNWSLTIKGGAVSPLQHYAFWPNARGMFGAELRKQVTPVMGLGVEGEWSVNTSSWDHAPAYIGLPHSANIIDHQLVGGFMAVNLNNMFGGYKGKPAALELEAVFGLGWWHAYKTGSTIIELPTETGDIEKLEIKNLDQNSWYTKAGLNINWNLGESKAWTLSLKPAVVWCMGKEAKQSTNCFNANYAAVEMQAGVTYHFANSHGAHYMTLCDKQYTQADIDALNAQINELRNRKPEVVEKVVERIVEKPVEKVVKGNDTESLMTNVFFRQGKSVVAADQLPNVERVAIYMKNHPASKVDITGYASPEGSKEINERLARERADAVKNLLINKYKIAANRITAKGQGVGNMFSEPEWNRVSVCDIIVK